MLFTLFILLTVNSAFTQNIIDVTLCGNAKNTIKKEKSNTIKISQEALFKCSELYSEDANFIIKSFSIGLAVGKDYQAITIEGNKLTEKARNFITKLNPKRFFIEKIRLTNSKGMSNNGKPLIILLKK